MKKIKSLLAILAAFLSINLSAQPKLILDTDFGMDADDLGALAMLHHFVDHERCELLAIMSWSTEQYAVSAIDAVNQYYGHPNIPIGTRKGQTSFEAWHYNKPLVDRFHHELDYVQAPDATFLYRKILSQSANKSITIVTIGPLLNIKNLLESPADSISDLTGKELVNQKVKEFVVMGGQFPEGTNEWNFDGEMPGVTHAVIPNIEVPIVFSGFELGLNVLTGKRFNKLDHNTPLYIGFMHFSQHAPWIKENFEGQILDNSSYDQTAVLYAVKKGIGHYWNKIEGGVCVADSTGGNKWVKQAKSNHAYLKLTMDEQQLAREIEAIMLGEF